MSIRWRLLVLALQVAILGYATYMVAGKPYVSETWFAAGILAVAINSQLLEPYYSRPGDVVGNSLFSLLLIASAENTVSQPGWMLLAIVLAASIILALVAIVFGAGKSEGRLVPLARASNIVIREVTAIRLFSIVFWLALFEAFPLPNQSFWVLGIAWALIVGIGAVDWQRVWASLRGEFPDVQVEGMIGPSLLLVSSRDIPNLGNPVSVRSGNTVADGVITARIVRADDLWAQIHIESESLCERLGQAGTVNIEPAGASDNRFLGFVADGSDDTSLVFNPVRSLEVGDVVSVRHGKDDTLYQVSSARVAEDSVKGGAHFSVRATAIQLGSFSSETLQLQRHRWVPSPGAAVRAGSPAIDVDQDQIEDSWIELGKVIGTQIPIYLDLEAAQEGHLAILGMTKMGKTSLAHRIATQLASDRFVLVMDQTREYASQRGLQPYQPGMDTTAAGICVYEPPPNMHPADAAERFLRNLVDVARREYEQGNIHLRSVIIDEAHQFVPEPAVLGFGAAGRDSSVAFGLLMMQVRKFGLSIVIISQRTAVVAKSALSQCENLIAFKSVDQTGLDYLESVAGGGVRRILPRLRQGEALVFGPAISSESPVAISVTV